jgi:hypothetical protein
MMGNNRMQCNHVIKKELRLIGKMVEDKEQKK